MVKEKRDKGGYSSRRRQCPNCGGKHRFTTYEVYARPDKGPGYGSNKSTRVVARGEANGNSFMTVLNVLDIRRLFHKEKLTRQQTSDKLRIPYGTVCDVIREKTWRHVPHQDYGQDESLPTRSGRDSVELPEPPRTAWQIEDDLIEAKEIQASRCDSGLFKPRWVQNKDKITAYGTESHFARLTDEAVIEIRRLHTQEKMSAIEIVKYFKTLNLSHSNVSKIIRYQTWTHACTLYDPNDFYPLG